MTTISKPVIYDAAAIAALTIDADDTNINGGEWARLLRFAGTGVFSGYTLTLSTVADTATLSVGWGIWQGFTCDVTVTHTVNLPAVASAKTYSIGILYDPANYSTPAGPLSVAVFDKAAITLPTSGQFWTLYEVDRTPSQSLAVSTLRNYKTLASATIYARSGVGLPPPLEFPSGTLCATPSALYVREGSAWLPVADDTGEVTTGFTPSGGWSNPGCSYRTANGLTTVHVRATRSGSSITATSTGSLADISTMTIPTNARSGWLETGRGSLTLGASGQTFGVDWRLSAAGLFTLTSTNPNVTIDAGTTVYATATFIR